MIVFDIVIQKLVKLPIMDEKDFNIDKAYLPVVAKANRVTRRLHLLVFSFKFMVSMYFLLHMYCCYKASSR